MGMKIKATEETVRKIYERAKSHEPQKMAIGGEIDLPMIDGHPLCAKCFIRMEQKDGQWICPNCGFGVE